VKWLADLKKTIRRVVLDGARRERFFRQDVTSYQSGNYQILAPMGHTIMGFMSSQPSRDLCIGIAAKYTCEKYPNGTIVDIGANIGDTAA
jgi:hypothetical protein